MAHEMNKIIAKISLICWGFVVAFVTCLVAVSAIPEDYVGFVSIILGGIILGLFFYDLRKIYQLEGFDFGWFMTIKKGYWRILLGLFGLILFTIGIFGLIFPQIGNELGERHAMKFVYLLVILFWIALTTTFLSWSLICFSESTAFGLIGKLKSALSVFSLGILWLFFATLFLSLFMDVIDENFYHLQATMQNWILIIFAVATIIVGLSAGKYADSSHLTMEE